MKILFVVPYLPTRIRIRPYELIRWLGMNGNSVTVVTQTSNSDTPGEVEELLANCNQLICLDLPRWRSLLNASLALPGSQPLQSVYSWNPLLARKLLELTGEKESSQPFDVVHVEHLRGVQFGLFLKQFTHIPVVWDSVDCISYLFQQSAKYNPRKISRWLNRFDLPRTLAFERKVVHKFNRVLVTSQVDKQAFLDLQLPGGTPPRIEVIPQGVDLEYFQSSEIEREPETLVISGKMSYHANIRMVLHLVEDIMPIVWKKLPRVKVWVVGKDPSPEILQLSKDARIKITGEVPDMRPYLQRAAAAVAPVYYGAGIQNKVLEAMACGTPVIASPSAVAALQARIGEDVFVASTNEDFASRIVEVLQNPNIARQLGLSGRRYVEKNHHWKMIVNHLENIYTEVTVEEGTKKP